MRRLLIAFISIVLMLSSFTVVYSAKGGYPGRPDITRVEGIILTPEKITLRTTDTRTLEVTVLPEDATNQDIIWKSSKSKIARITPDGTVAAMKPGEATITATTKDGRFTATCTVTVIASVPPDLDISGDWWLTFDAAPAPDAAFNDLVQDENGIVSGEYWTYNGGIPVYGGPVSGFVSGDFLYLFYERERGYHGEFLGTIDSGGMTGTFESFTTPFYGTWVGVQVPQLPF